MGLLKWLVARHRYGLYLERQAEIKANYTKPLASIDAWPKPKSFREWREKKSNDTTGEEDDK